MRLNKSIVRISVMVLLLAVAVGVCVAVLQETENMPVTSAPRSTEDTIPETTEADVDWSRTVEQNGVLYQLNPSLKTILFLGADQGGTVLPGLAPGEGRRADTIFLLLLDQEKQETTLLAISRDTITNVDAYDVNGDYTYTAPTHINMQYFYGDSSARSCFLMKRTVSRLLYDMRIDGCFSLNAEGIVSIVNELGGITITMPADYTEIDPRYQEGAKLTLNGKETEHLLRHRDTSESGSNEQRVDRQVCLLKSLVQELQKNAGVQRMEELLRSAGDDVYSDLDAETLKMLLSYRLNPESYSLPGSVVEGEDHDEFHVDESALRKLLIELFYQPAG